MVDWLRTLTLNPEFAQARYGDISYRDFAAVIAERLEALPPFPRKYRHINNQRDGLVHEFCLLAGDRTVDSDAINAMLSGLYRWGDTVIDGMAVAWSIQKVCFIDTISLPARVEGQIALASRAR